MSFLSIDFRSQENDSDSQWTRTVFFGMLTVILWACSVLLFGFSAPAYLVAMLVLAGLLFFTPTAGLSIIILGTMWFERWFTLQPIVLGTQSYKLYPLDVVMFITAVSFLFHQAFGQQKRSLRLRRLDGWLLFFFLLCFGYFIVAAITPTVDFDLAGSAFKNYAFYGCLFWLVMWSVQTVDELRDLIKTFLIGGWGIIVFVIIGLVRGEGLWTQYTPLSTEGTRTLAFPHAFFLCLAMVISLVLMFYRLRPQRTTLITLWVQLVGVIGSLMRHLWISLAIVAVCLFVVFPRTLKNSMMRFFAKNAAVVGLIAVLITFFVVVFPFSGTSLRVTDVVTPLVVRAQSLLYGALDSSARWRIYAWQAAKEVIAAHPILGIGYGQELAVNFTTYRAVVPIRDLHNSYLVLAVQMGFLGFGIFTIIVFSVLWAVWKAFRHQGILWPYQLALFSAWALFLLAALWQPYFETNLTGIFFWILMGGVMASIRLDADLDQVKIQ